MLDTQQAFILNVVLKAFQLPLPPQHLPYPKATPSWLIVSPVALESIEDMSGSFIIYRGL